MFNLEDWRVIGEYVYDGEGGRHQAFYSPIRDIYYKDIHFRAGERIQVEQSLKYSQKETLELWERSGLNEVKRWSASSDNYSEFKTYFSKSLFALQIMPQLVIPRMRLCPTLWNMARWSHDYLRGSMWGRCPAIFVRCGARAIISRSTAFLMP